MTQPIRVLVVDDSVVVRKLLSDILSADPNIEVVGVAATGEIALKKLPLLKPDLVTLDFEMPGINGLETLSHIREQDGSLPVLMVSSFTDDGARITLDALERGASDYIGKPSTGKEGAGLKEFSELLVRKITGLCQRGVSLPAQSPKPAITKPFAAKRLIDITVIGVSTGGPNALQEVIGILPSNYPTPIFIVQHMPPMFTKLLAKRLDELSSLNVIEAQAGMRASAGGVYIAPGDYHMTIARGNAEWVIELNQEPPEHSCRPAVDPLFLSAVRAAEGNVLAVMMTGMGQDGLIGCQAVREQGGHVLCQDEATSVVWGMPGFVAQHGLADAVLPLQDIATHMADLSFKVGRSHTLQKNTPCKQESA